jgi:hypothetical protein
MRGRNRHLLLPPRARTGKGLPQAVPTDVTALDTDERPEVHCGAATDCSSIPNNTSALPHPYSRTQDLWRTQILDVCAGGLCLGISSARTRDVGAVELLNEPYSAR